MVSEPSKSILHQLDSAEQILLTARQSYDYWWFLQNSENASKYRRSFTHFTEYFAINSSAHLSNYVVRICILLDKTKGSKGIQHTLKLIKNDLNTVKKLLLTTDNELREVETVGEKLKQLRSNIYAHRSNSKTPVQIYDEVKITPDEMVAHQNRLLKIYNDLRAAYNLGNVEFRTEFIAADLARIWDVLEKSII